MCIRDRVYLCAILVTMRFALPDMARFVWFLAAYLLIGLDVFRKLGENLMQKKFLTEYTLIILATVGAFGVSRYTEGVDVYKRQALQKKEGFRRALAMHGYSG